MKVLLSTLTTLLIATSAFAAYPVNIKCTGAGALKKKVSLNISGVEYAKSPGGTPLTVTLTLKVNTSKATIDVRDLDNVKGRKIEINSSLTLYTFNPQIPDNDYPVASISITNKKSEPSTLTLIDREGRNPEILTLSCDNAKN